MAENLPRQRIPPTPKASKEINFPRGSQRPVQYAGDIQYCNARVPAGACLASIPLLLEWFEKDLKRSCSIILGQRIGPFTHIIQSTADNLRRGIISGPWLHRCLSKILLEHCRRSAQLETASRMEVVSPLPVSTPRHITRRHPPFQPSKLFLGPPD